MNGEYESMRLGWMRFSYLCHISSEYQRTKYPSAIHLCFSITKSLKSMLCFQIIFLGEADEPMRVRHQNDEQQKKHLKIMLLKTERGLFTDDDTKIKTTTATTTTKPATAKTTATTT